MSSGAAEGIGAWGTFETVVYCNYSLFLSIFYVDHSSCPPVSFSFLFSCWFNSSSLLSSAYCMPGIILGARNTPPCSLETYRLVRRVNNEQLKQGIMFTMNRPRQGVVTEQCDTVLGGEGRPLTPQGCWILNDKKEQAVFSFLCPCCLHSSPQTHNSLAAFTAFYVPRVEANVTPYLFSLSRDMWEIQMDCPSFIGLHFLTPYKNSLIIMYFRRFSSSSTSPLLHPPVAHNMLNLLL